MMIEELGIIEGEESPVKNALVTFFSFCVFGFIPVVTYVIAYIFDLEFNYFLVATIVTGCTMVLLGVVKSSVTGASKIKGGCETLLIGVIAAGASFLIGWLLEGLEDTKKA